MLISRSIACKLAAVDIGYFKAQAHRDTLPFATGGKFENDVEDVAERAGRPQRKYTAFEVIALAIFMKLAEDVGPSLASKIVRNTANRIETFRKSALPTGAPNRFIAFASLTEPDGTVSSRAVGGTYAQVDANLADDSRTFGSVLTKLYLVNFDQILLEIEARAAELFPAFDPAGD